jgi:aspartate aminotransferase
MGIKLSKTVNNMIASEILKISGEVKTRVANGEQIYNLTVGDFNPDIFPIPEKLRDLIIQNYNEGMTNYPMANGEPSLRQSIVEMYKKNCNIDYQPDEVIVGGGGRPLLFCIFFSIIDAGDGVIYPVPSWNNEHYCILTHAKSYLVETKAEDHFMPQPSDLKPYLKDANLIAINSPLNPSGTVISKEALNEICEMVLAENKRRGPDQKALYLLYDQIYSNLTFGDAKHYNPVSLNPQMKPYTIIVDGISKWLAGTGVRVGWALGPKDLMLKIKTLLGHVGAWSPKPEQLATAAFLQDESMDEYLEVFRKRVDSRLEGFYKVFSKLKEKGYPVDVIAPEAAIYLTVELNLVGATTADNKKLGSVEDVFEYILNEAGVALVPFYAFGASENLPWFRLSIGTTESKDIAIIEKQLEDALSKLTFE